MLRVLLLGQPSLFLDAEPLPWNVRPKVLLLLTYLLLHRSVTLVRDHVAAVLTPDEPTAVARANLHLLQRALPPSPIPWITIDSKHIQWNPAVPCWLDVTDFIQACATDATLAEAVTLYRGDLLEPFDADWLFCERERLRDLYLTALTRLAHLHQDQRDYPTAITYAQQLLRAEPFREDT